MYCFAHWLSRQRERADTVGDLAREVADDAGFGRSARSLGACVLYLRGRGVSREALAALPGAWGEWQAHPPAQTSLLLV